MRAVYAKWNNGIPYCPDCNHNRFNITYRETVEYPVDASNPELSDNFYLHEHTMYELPYIVLIVCSYCYSYIVVDDKIRNFFAPKEEYSS